MRVVQSVGSRGSLKWLQRAVNCNQSCLEHAEIGAVQWLSPLRDDDFAEYRDAAFLERLGLSRLSEALRDFWPKRGPQWDALGLAGDRVILVEAKAHIDEFFSPPSAATGKSRETIAASLTATREALGVSSSTDWSTRFYQFANRLAHLYFLRSHGVDAYLLFVDFICDDDMRGPTCADEWAAVYRTAEYAFGLPKTHALSKFVFHVYPDTRYLNSAV